MFWIFNYYNYFQKKGTNFTSQLHYFTNEWDVKLKNCCYIRIALKKVQCKCTYAYVGVCTYANTVQMYLFESVDCLRSNISH